MDDSSAKGTSCGMRLNYFTQNYYPFFVRASDADNVLDYSFAGTYIHVRTAPARIDRVLQMT